MVAPTSLKNQRVSLLPGDVTYLDVLSGQDGFKPAYLVNPNTADLLADIQDTRQTINSAYFVDLFMMLQNINTRSMPVEAVIEMKEEKLLMLGPVLERLNDEALNPLIDRVFSIMARKNMLPPPPDVMQGMPLRIEYISVMAQAQKSIGSPACRRPLALSASSHSSNLKRSTSSTWIRLSTRSPKCPAYRQPSSFRRSRCRAFAKSAPNSSRQQAMQMGMAAAQGAKTLSETQTTDPSALTAITNAAGAQQQ
jgi:hypothetical protein